MAVTLDDGGAASSRRTEEVYVRVNQAPVAAAGPDRVVCPGDPVAFDAGLSADGDGTLTSWRWSFSDGVVLEGPQVERSFDAPGLREVELTVTDDSGSACAAGTDVATVLVNAPPTVDAGPDRETPVGAANDTVVFDASGAADPTARGTGRVGLRRRPPRRQRRHPPPLRRARRIHGPRRGPRHHRPRLRHRERHRDRARPRPGVAACASRSAPSSSCSRR